MEPIPEHYPLTATGQRMMGYPIPSLELVLTRLEQIDFRLRQLEEKQQLSMQRLPQQDNYFVTDLRRQNATVRPIQQPCESSMSLAMKEVHLKGTLMDRLRLLESRISQLGFDLEKGCNSSAITSVTRTEPEEAKLLIQSGPSSETATPASRRLIGGPKKSAACDHFQGQMPKVKKAKDPKDMLNAAEKKVNSICREEKRRMARTRLYKKWFPVGC